MVRLAAQLRRLCCRGGELLPGGEEQDRPGSHGFYLDGGKAA
ncbi:MAG: hypothetical protein U5P10_14400 [Spirochaetia bacterium]|nr:hypothetical protein [Spirochaetia bacterium]